MVAEKGALGCQSVRPTQNVDKQVATNSKIGILILRFLTDLIGRRFGAIVRGLGFVCARSDSNRVVGTAAD